LTTTCKVYLLRSKFLVSYDQEQTLNVFLNNTNWLFVL